MGTYSNIWANNLERECTIALDELAKNKVDGICKNLNNNKIWTSQNKNKCISALNDINSSDRINGSIHNLEKKINNLLVISKKIQKIKEKEKLLRTEENKSEEKKSEWTIKNLKSDIRSLEYEVNSLLK